MFRRQKALLIVSFLLLAICFQIGFWLASQRPLWNDEVFTQLVSIGQRTYFELVQGKISEGNVCPLFYVLQKGFCDIFQYQIPPEWAGGNWAPVDVPSQIFLRINPILFMSLTVVALFYFFSRFEGLLAGIFSLYLSLSSYMIWIYWVEARPYALWVFLTTLQSLIFLYLLREKQSSSKAWTGLGVVHGALAVTTIFSVAQITILSFLLWVFVEKKFRRYIGVAVIPFMLALFYYSRSPHFSYYFTLDPQQLFLCSYPRDRFYLLLIFCFFLFLYFLQTKFSFFKLYRDDTILTPVPYLLLTILMFIPTFLILFIFVLGDTHGVEGFAISNRYFIYLTPISIIGMTLFTSYLLKAFKDKWWMLLATLGGTGYLVWVRTIKTYGLVKEFYPFLQ